MSLASAACGQVVGLGDERTVPDQDGGADGGSDDGGNDGRLWCDGVVLWVKQFGDASAQTARAIVPDGKGGVYIAGFFGGALDLGGAPLVSAGGDDIFLAHLDENGSHVWSKRLGGSDNQSGHMTLTAVADGVILSGEFKGTVDFGDGSRTAVGFSDGFVAKYDAQGKFLWSQTVSGPSPGHSEIVSNVAVDANGDLYFSTVFVETVALADQTFTSKGMKDILLTRLSASGAHVWSRQFGSAGDDAPNWVTIDATDRLLMGATSAGSLSIGQEELPMTSGWDLLLGAYQADDGAALLTRRYGGAGDSSVARLAIDKSSNQLVVAGFLKQGASLNLGAGELFANYGAFLARLSPQLNHFASRAIDNFETPRALSPLPDGGLLVGGTFVNVASFGPKPIATNGKKDGVLMKLGPGLEHVWTLQVGSIEDDDVYDIAVDEAANAFALAHFQDEITLDGCGVLKSAGSTDLLLIKLKP